MKFLTALKNYFGYLPVYKGQSGLKGFALEVKELTETDRAELAPLLAEELGETVELN
mgnify:CR=1 FL=1